MTYELARTPEEKIRAVLTREGVDLSRAMALARPIVDDVRIRGDSALREYAERLDGFKGGPLTLGPGLIKRARSRVSKDLVNALATSKRRIETFHSRQGIKPFEYRDSCGAYGQKVVPLSRVGVYVPGGSADYVSTVLMACVPARVAGVKKIALCTPGRGGQVPDSILAAAGLCGIAEVHPVGGAQAIAAMAYGTESIAKVQKIVGPGGAVVTAAKLLVRNDCEIDFLAGPSEVLVIADSSADPAMIAADMLAQLEHDPLARAVLVTTSSAVAARAKSELEKALGSTRRRSIATEAAEKGAVFVTTRSLDEAVRFSNLYAPEHLLLDVKNPKKLLAKVESAGSVFLGRYSSVAFGDYCSGTNHVLPTKGAASMKSALSVYDFVKIIPYQDIGREGAARLSKTVDILARSEGLEAHAEAALARARSVKK